MTSEAALNVGALLDALVAQFPLSWAEPWDAVGLRAGDPSWPAGRIFVTLDADRAALSAAVAAGCSVVVSHHPPALQVPEALTPATPAGAFLLEAVTSRLAVLSFHTNLDRAPAGGDALPHRLGLEVLRPLERSMAEVEVVVVYVPPDARDVVLGAMARAGAGRIGAYDECSFAASGTGRFTPRTEAQPAAGTGGPSAVAEERVEVVAPAGTGAGVAAAARAVHPYEEPVIVVSRASLSRGTARLGRLCAVADLTLGELANRVASRLGVHPRVWGDPAIRVSIAAVANGSGGSLIPDALAARAQALVAGEVRYHDATAAVAAGLAVIEAGHDVTEWPLVDVLGDACAGVVGADAVVRAEPRIGWWTAEGA